MSHLRPLNPTQAVTSMMTPQMMELMVTNIGDASVPIILATMLAKAPPQVADWIPNQPTQAIASSVLIMYRAPFSPSAPEAITETGRPVSQACIPMQIMYAQIRP